LSRKRFQLLFHFQPLRLQSRHGLGPFWHPARRPRMPRWLQYAFAGFIVLLLLGGPCAYARYRHFQLRNFHVVREGVLYRSGQLSVEGLKRLVHDYRIKTVVTLRDAQRPGDLAPDFDEEDWCRKEEMNYFRLREQAWLAPEG